MVSTDDVVLANIRGNGRNGIDFDMYVMSGSNGVLNVEALIEAVAVSLHTV